MELSNFLKQVLIFSIFLGSAAIGNAQPGVRGSREVVSESGILEDFKKLVVTDGLEVTLLKSRTPGYDLEMDDNLIALIDFDIKDSQLTVSLTKTIRSSKRLNITLRYTALEGISVEGRAMVSGSSLIEAINFEGAVRGGSELEIDLKSETTSFTIDQHSKLALNFTGDDLELSARDRAFAKADINTNRFTLIAHGRSDIELTGNANESMLTLSENAEFKGRVFDVDTIKLIASGNSKTTLIAEENILIDISGNSKLNLYGEPEITVDRMTGTSTLQKRE